MFSDELQHSYTITYRQMQYHLFAGKPKSFSPIVKQVSFMGLETGILVVRMS